MKVLVKYGFGSVARRYERFIPLSDRIFKVREESLDLTQPERVRLVLEELGPTALKFGQWMSTRPDLLPIEYVRELEKVQDRVPPFSFEIVETLILNELGAPIDELFSYFPRKVIASGSIAQVYKAKLKDGTNVAVKVQRPGVRDTIETDMEILYDLAKFAGEHIIKSDLYNPVELVDEFIYAVEKQLEFRNEARSIDRFRENFKETDYVLAPKVFLELTTDKILTLQFIDGVKINDTQRIDKQGLSRREISTNLTRAYLKQVYIDGFFHGDPHPGNIFAMPYNIIGFTDFGIIGRLSPNAREHMVKILFATMKRDSDALAEAFYHMGVVVGDVDLGAFSKDLEKIIDHYYGVSLENFRLGEYLSEIIKVMRKNHMKLLPEMALLSVTMWSVEGIIREIDPEFNTFEVAKPFVEDLIKSKLNPVNRIRALGNNVIDYYDFFDGFPKRADHILSKIEKGELAIIFRDERLERLNQVVDHASNRLLVGAIVSAIILGSSLIITSGHEPMVFGFPIIEISTIIAIALGMWLIISIFRSGKY